MHRPSKFPLHYSDGTNRQLSSVTTDSSTTPSAKEDISVLVGLCAVAASTMIVEICLTKFLSYKVYHHFVHAIIATVILSFGASGAWLYLSPERFGTPEKNGWKTISICAALYGISLIIATLIFCWMPIDPYREGLLAIVRLSSLVSYCALFAIPFFLAGLCLSYTLASSRRKVASIYFWDLLASSIGASLCPLILESLGGYGAILLASVGAMIGAVAFARANKKEAVAVVDESSSPGGAGADPTPDGGEPAKTSCCSKSTIGLAALYVVAFAALVFYPQWAVQTYGFDIRSSKEPVARSRMIKEFHGIERTYWNAVARIDLSNTVAAASPWNRLVLQDGGAYTPQLLVKGAIADHPEFGKLIWTTPHVIHPGSDRILIIGAGGGRDIVFAKYFGVKNVDAVELNPSTVKHILNGVGDAEASEYQPWLQSDANTHVNILNREGRQWCSAQPAQSYDIVHASAVDTLTAVSSGAMAMVENYLYTKEAVAEYVRVIKPGGILSLTHWQQHPPRMALRMFTTYIDYLESHGNTSPWQNLLVVAGDGWTDTLMKTTPFTQAEIEKIRGWAGQNNIKILFDPFNKSTGPERDIDPSERIYTDIGFADPAKRAELYKQYPLDITPVNDDRPYFYQVDKAENFWVPDPFASAPWFMVYGTLIAAIALALAPLKKLRREHISAETFPFAVFFGACGFAFLLYEVSTIQLFSVFSGGPLYALAVVLVSVLAGYAIGSGLAGFLKPSKRTFMVLGIALPLVLAALTQIAPILIKASMPTPLSVHLLVAALCTAVVSVVVGMPVSLGMTMVRARHGNASAWMWGINSAFNALGAVAFIIITQLTGITFAIYLCAGIYLLANFGLALTACRD